jgi:hypothetical protein
MMIARIDDPDNPEQMTELWRGSMPEVDLAEVTPQGYLDGLESTVMEKGWELMRKLMVEQWCLTDSQLVERFRQEHLGEVSGDGHDLLKVASRLGVLQLPRQVCEWKGEKERHHMPGNAGLPEHEGQVTTRGLQEWVCLLPQDLPFSTANRMLGWMTHDEAVMSETQERRWVSVHGQIIRQAEQQEVAELLARTNLDGLQAQMAEAQKPRRPAAWPEELTAAVEAALSQPDPQPPAGVSQEDWARVLQVHRNAKETKAADLRRLGPEVAAGQVIASTDDVEVRRPENRRFLQLRTAYVRTAQGYRYLSGSAANVLNQLLLLLRLCGGVSAKVTLLGDGARWIADFFKEYLAAWPLAELILDWYHCKKRCYDLTSLICRGRKAKNELVGSLLRHLWRGQVQEAIDILEAYRPQAKNLEKLDELIRYLDNRRQYLPNYRERRIQQQYISSAHTEKANDLIVARRQKHQGMHWGEQTSDALAALRTLMLNGGWDAYWQDHQVLSLAIPVDADHPIALAC